MVDYIDLIEGTPLWGATAMILAELLEWIKAVEPLDVKSSLHKVFVRIICLTTGKTNLPAVFIFIMGGSND